MCRITLSVSEPNTKSKVHEYGSNDDRFVCFLSVYRTSVKGSAAYVPYCALAASNRAPNTIDIIGDVSPQGQRQ